MPFILTAFHDLKSIVGPLKNREFKGVLVDAYVAGAMKEFSSQELRVNKIIDHNSYYGVVFGGGRLSGKKIQNCFEDYVLSNQAQIFEDVKQNTKSLSVSLFLLFFKALPNTDDYTRQNNECYSYHPTTTLTWTITLILLGSNITHQQQSFQELLS